MSHHSYFFIIYLSHPTINIAVPRCQWYFKNYFLRCPKSSPPRRQRNWGIWQLSGRDHAALWITIGPFDPGWGKTGAGTLPITSQTLGGMYMWGWECYIVILSRPGVVGGFRFLYIDENMYVTRRRIWCLHTTCCMLAVCPMVNPRRCVCS